MNSRVFLQNRPSRPDGPLARGDGQILTKPFTCRDNFSFSCHIILKEFRVFPCPKGLGTRNLRIFELGLKRCLTQWLGLQGLPF